MGGGGTHRFKNCLKDALGIREDLIVPKSHNTVTTTHEPALARRALVRMLAAIDFDDELCLGTVEIHDIETHRLLTAKA